MAPGQGNQLETPSRDGGGDPFSSNSHHRYSNFDDQLFSLDPSTSPEQAKRALEAHLTETERRIQDASKLGTTLVHQREELAVRLKEVEKQQAVGDMTPELKQKLVEIEREYNEVGRESARALLPKRLSSGELGPTQSPLRTEPKRSISPSRFESQATNSPSKLNVPSRRQRNQPANRVHDIEFATEISTSLLTQVRHLQGLLAEKEETLKNITLENASREAEAEAFNQRLRALDESESRYKDENWNLETQIHEHIASAKEAADREKKLTQALNVLQLEKTTAQKEIDEIKLGHANLLETHTTAVKQHDMELGGFKRNITMAENERAALQRKIEDITGQNQELAKAISRQRVLSEEQERQSHTAENLDIESDDSTPEHSPPVSPMKYTPRHSHLESETLKSSLQHAHRMIQSLKGNIHREKTEKLELKRMLQDARDELDVRRAEAPLAPSKRSRKAEAKENKKLLKPAQLGAPRNSRSEVVEEPHFEDPQWEDQEDLVEASPTRAPAARMLSIPSRSESSDKFATSNETSNGTSNETSNETSNGIRNGSSNENSDGFETANERAAETDDFQTGNEASSDSDELTETEGGANVSTIRAKKVPAALTLSGNRDSMQSTASLSGDEYDYGEMRTPRPTQQPQRLRLKVRRESTRRPRMDSLESTFSNSAHSSIDTPEEQHGQSLFAELGELNSDDDDEGSDQDGDFPSRSRTDSTASVPLPPTEVPRTPVEKSKPDMVNSGMMTDQSTEIVAPLPAAGVAEGVVEAGDKSNDEQSKSYMSVLTTQIDQLEERLSQFSAPVVPQHEEVPLSVSSINAQHVEPVTPEVEDVLPVPMAFSSIESMATEPLSPVERPATPIKLVSSHIESMATEPLSPVERPATPIKLVSSHIESAATEPIEPVVRPDTPPRLRFVPIESSSVEPLSPVELPATPVNLVSSHIESAATEPISPVLRPATPPRLALAPIEFAEVEPLSPVERPTTPVQLVSSHIESAATEPISPVARPATPRKLAYVPISTADTEPISPVERPVTPPRLAYVQISSAHTEPVCPAERPPTPVNLAISSIGTRTMEPLDPVERPVTPPNLDFVSIESTAIEPISPKEPVVVSTRATDTKDASTATRPATPVEMAISSVATTATEPLSPERLVTPAKIFAPISSTETEPLSPAERPITPVKLSSAPIESTATEPVSPIERSVAPADMTISSVGSTATEPVAPVEATPAKMAFSSIDATMTEPVSPLERPETPIKLGFSSVKSIITEPVSPVDRPVTPIAMAFSSISQIETEPIEPASPIHDLTKGAAVIGGSEDNTTAVNDEEVPGLVHDGIEDAIQSESEQGSVEIKKEDPETPPRDVLANLSHWRETSPMPFIAVDETRQSLGQSTSSEAPEWQRPFEELPVDKGKKPQQEMTDSTAQTSITAGQIDAMFAKKAERQTAIVREDSRRSHVSGFRSHKSHESMSSARHTRQISDQETDHDMTPRRPTSAGSNGHLSPDPRPPLPLNHQQVIAAAAQRAGSSASNQPSLMGPPPRPAFGSRNPNSYQRPKTPASSHGPESVKNGTATFGRSTNGAGMDVFTSNPIRPKSRASSVTSFASEVDSRFNLRDGHTDMPGMGSGTDPRMIQAITQTMIGEYLWKYTRKTGRSEMSDTRHRRYFWVHPYTRTLYWSDRDPSTAGRVELRAKSVAIEAVRVVTDDNPMPPGLHRKSLVVLTPGRAVKFTAQTGHRHETWFNAMSYLLQRADSTTNNNETAVKDEDMVSALTSDDVDEFNPGYGRPAPRGTGGSIYSTGSRMKPSDSSARMLERPTLVNNTASSRTSMVSRLSNYLRPGEVPSARRARQVSGAGSGRESSLYEASMVHDSAEDLRRIIQRQDRESDRLENVRACCDGKHDVRHLSHTPNSSNRGLRSHGPPRSYTPSLTPVPGGRPGATSRQSRLSKASVRSKQSRMSRVSVPERGNGI